MVDQALFHQLRSRGRGFAHGLLLVLLATWLAAVCPHCLAQVQPASDRSGSVDTAGESMHCHGDFAPAVVEFDASNNHDGCPQAPICSGGDCAQLTAITPGEPLEVLIAEVAAPALVGTDFISHAWPSTPPPAAADVPVLAAAGCPLYLRHCAFLN